MPIETNRNLNQTGKTYRLIRILNLQLLDLQNLLQDFVKYNVAFVYAYAVK